VNECKGVRDLLALRPAEWSANERRQIEAHLVICPDCTALAEQYAEQDRLIRAAPRVRLIPSQRDQLFVRIQREGRRREMHIRLSAILGTAVAVVALTALTLGLNVLSQHNDQPTIVAPAGPHPTDGGTPLTTPGSITVATGCFQWPTTQHDISGWTFRDPRNPDHLGLDIAAALGAPIVAADGGVVIFAGWEDGGYGNLVIVEHTDEWSSYYAQLDEITVKVGQQVRQGELLGRAGSTGYASGPHLHFELRYQDLPVDPQIYLPSSGSTDEDALLPTLVGPVKGHIALSLLLSLGRVTNPIDNYGINGQVGLKQLPRSHLDQPDAGLRV
jgi:murein DD-endopeptidase MepM/ murein hydrolase activator NlpD